MLAHFLFHLFLSLAGIISMAEVNITATMRFGPGIRMKFQEFSIKELESFSGVKAHTIRIWEQRYGLLAPERSDTNIRKYSDKDLRLLLNVSLLNSLGYKISKIATLSEQEMNQIISEHTRAEHGEQKLMHVLKMSMLNYDEAMFNSVMEPLIHKQGLEKTFTELIIPFLKQIGYLWQAGAICPAQEHFISSLVRQKIFAAMDKLRDIPSNSDPRTFVLYLPELEIHELSINMAAYVLKEKGFRVIMLGQAVPFDDLIQVYQRLGPVHFISMFTTNPPAVLTPDYLRKIRQAFSDTQCHFHFTGKSLEGIHSPDPELITLYSGAEPLVNAIRN